MRTRMYGGAGAGRAIFAASRLGDFGGGSIKVGRQLRIAHVLEEAPDLLGRNPREGEFGERILGEKCDLGSLAAGRW